MRTASLHRIAGTHVAGTVLGENLGSMGAVGNNGMAPKAKLAFFDLSVGSGGLNVPNLHTVVLPMAAQVCNTPSLAESDL
jgi:hypothetical protein